MPPIREREEARRERQQKKVNKRKRIIWVIIAIVVAVLLVMKIIEIGMNSSVKPIVENGKLSISSSESSDYPYAIDSSKVKVEAMEDKLCLLTDSTLTLLNVANANADLSISHGFANPIMETSGRYVCLYDQGSNRFRLDNDKENVYEMKTKTPILCAGVSKNGRVAYAVRGDNSKSTVYVVNKSQSELMKLDVNTGYVVAAALDYSGKKLAIASINSKDAKLITTIEIYNVGNDEMISSFVLEAVNLMDLHYSKSSDLYVVATNCVQVITNQKKQNVVFDLGEINTNCFTYTDKDELVIAYSKYAGATKDFVSYVKSSGKVKTTIELEANAKYVSSNSNNATVLFSDKIITYSLRNGEVKEEVECDETVSSANRLSSKIFITRQQLVDVMR